MATESAEALRLVGERVRARREAAGLSQGDLARQVFVARQTVSNWETGKTLPDVQSLLLLARLFGTSVDELLGEEAQRAVRATADERHELLVTLAKTVLLGVAYLLFTVIDLLDRADGTAAGTSAERGVFLLLSVVRLVLMLTWCVYQARMARLMRERNLPTAVEIVAFLEGREPGESLPDDFAYKVLLPYWRVWWWALILVVFGFTATAMFLG